MYQDWKKLYTSVSIRSTPSGSLPLPEFSLAEYSIRRLAKRGQHRLKLLPPNQSLVGKTHRNIVLSFYIGLNYPKIKGKSYMLTIFLNPVEWMLTGPREKAELVQYIMLCGKRMSLWRKQDAL
jgi:hypothetical protein